VQALDIVHAALGVFIQCFCQFPAGGLDIVCPHGGPFVAKPFVGAVGIQVQDVGFNRLLQRVEPGNALVAQFFALILRLYSVAAEIPLAKQRVALYGKS
jgi:hypothetical protein